MFCFKLFLFYLLFFKLFTRTKGFYHFLSYISLIQKGEIYVDSSFQTPETSDGSLQKPFNNLSFAINRSLTINDEIIILKLDDIYSDLKEDVQLTKTLTIKSMDQYACISLNSGMIHIKNNVTFENVKFMRSIIDYNQNAILVETNAILSFSVLYEFLMIYFFF